MSTENVEMARRGVEHFNRGDRNALAEMAAPDIELVPMRAALEGTVYRGTDAFAQFWAAVDETWETIHLDAGEYLDCGDRVLITGRLRGRARGTEIEVDSPMWWVLRVDAGKLVSLRTYLDATEARTAAGLTV
jgi:ketosteroid isomerase-like protein